MPKFEVGNPGGPGRPRGSRSMARFIFEEIGEEAAQTVLDKVLEAAQNGDLRAAELLFRHMYPRRKGRPVNFEVPRIEKPKDLVAAQAAVVEAVACGDLTPQEGSDVANVMEKHRLAIETADHEPRITALEHSRGLR